MSSFLLLALLFSFFFYYYFFSHFIFARDKAKVISLSLIAAHYNYHASYRSDCESEMQRLIRRENIYSSRKPSDCSEIIVTRQLLSVGRLFKELTQVISNDAIKSKVVTTRSNDGHRRRDKRKSTDIGENSILTPSPVPFSQSNFRFSLGKFHSHT